jgi:hypothetical protein
MVQSSNLIIKHQFINNPAVLKLNTWYINKEVLTIKWNKSKGKLKGGVEL